MDNSHFSLLGLPYVQPADHGILLLRGVDRPILTYCVYNNGHEIWSGILGLGDVFHLVFTEVPRGLSSSIRVRSNFGPRIDYVVFPVKGRIALSRRGNQYFFDSGHLYGTSYWRLLVSQVLKATVKLQKDLGRSPQILQPVHLKSWFK